NAGDILGVSLVDHLIIGDTPKRYYSFREAGLL
ncbi:MAG TPA: JAB domain-containing protein, partial [Fervidobacterium sp.]|nr:JAB domain-containing protein [Fervidobacterium sp.]